MSRRRPRPSRQTRPAPYLAPYARAHARGLRGAEALLWEGLRDQQVRFQALLRNVNLQGRHVLDVGCGRAELLAFLRAREIEPARYTGLEAQAWLARAARRRRGPSVAIVKADFVREPASLDVGADVVVFSGSLNLLPSRLFYRTLRQALAVAREAVAFNFLSTPDLAGAAHLRWHRPRTVVAFGRRLGARVRVDEAYEPGDCTVVMEKPPPLAGNGQGVSPLTLAVLGEGGGRSGS